MKFPTYEQMAKRVAEKALDDVLYEGKSIREWIRIIAEQGIKTEQDGAKTELDPLAQSQVNEIALYEILKKYSKRYRKEITEHRARNKK